MLRFRQFDHEVTTIVVMVRDLTVGILNNLNIIYWDKINKRWTYFDEFLRVYALEKLINVVLSWRETVKVNSGDYWNLGKLIDVKSEDLWGFCKANGLDNNGHELTEKYHWIDLD